MAPGTGLLVDYTLVPVTAGEYPHGEGQVWADASSAHAAALILRLLDDPAEARAMGRRAQAHVRQTLSVEAMGRRYLDRLTAIGRA